MTKRDIPAQTSFGATAGEPPAAVGIFLFFILTGLTSATTDPVDMGASIGMSGRFELASDIDNHSPCT